MRIALLCISALVCTGCPQKYVARTVALAGLTGDAQTSASVTANSGEVQSALKIINGVVASHGFAPTTDTNLTVYGSLVTYAKYTPEGHGTIFPSTSISLNRDTLEFVAADRPNLTLEDKQLLKTVKTELKSHYGADRVKTRR